MYEITNSIASVVWMQAEWFYQHYHIKNKEKLFCNITDCHKMTSIIHEKHSIWYIYMFVYYILYNYFVIKCTTNNIQLITM